MIRPRHIPFCAVWITAACCNAAILANVPPSEADTDSYAQNACVQCHRDLPGRSSEIVGLEWRHSVHYSANVGCDGCHGGNPALRREQFESDEAFKRASHLERDPEFLMIHRTTDEFVTTTRGRSVSYFCGKCHATIKEKHLGSPHGDFGDPSCLYCHGQGTHEITPASPAIIDIRARPEPGRCNRCHEAGTMEVVARISKILTTTQEQIKTSGQAYATLESWGYRNLELEKLHHHAAEVQSQLRRIFHGLNMREINEFAGEIQEIIDRTQATVELVEQLRRTRFRQTIVGICAVTLLMSLAGLLVYYKCNFLEEHESNSAFNGGASSGVYSDRSDRGV